jgi:hypothetical protein
MERANVPAGVDLGDCTATVRGSDFVSSARPSRGKTCGLRLLLVDDRTGDMMHRSLMDGRLHEASKKRQEGQYSTVEQWLGGWWYRSKASAVEVTRPAPGIR